MPEIDEDQDLSKHDLDNGPLHKHTSYGCLFCRSSSEEKIIDELGIAHPEMECIFPKRIRVRRQGGEEAVSLFPGYILFKTTDKTDFQRIRRKKDVFRLLTYSNGEWKLSGSDLDTTILLFEMKGLVGLSKAYFDREGNVRMISGPLKTYENNITAINKRMKTAKVQLVFQDRRIEVWLGYEIVEGYEEPGTCAWSDNQIN